MAILKGIDVSVVIHGKPLTEYDDEDAADRNSEHPSEVSKYIEVVSDAEFRINIIMSQSYDLTADGLSFRLSLDGVSVRNRLCRKAKLKRLRKDWHDNIAGSYMKNGEEWYLRPFKFNDIKIGKTILHVLISYSLRYLVEASTSTVSSMSVARLGTIRVDVFDVKITRKSQDASSGMASLDQPSEITEKELKGRNVTLQSRYASFPLLVN